MIASLDGFTLTVGLGMVFALASVLFIVCIGVPETMDRLALFLRRRSRDIKRWRRKHAAQVEKALVEELEHIPSEAMGMFEETEAKR